MTIQVGGLTVRLTPEHLRVMGLVARGKTYAQIGQELGLCTSTVKNRVLDVKNRMGMHTRIEVVLALRDVGMLA